jgi:hypothetical protein
MPPFAPPTAADNLKPADTGSCVTTVLTDRDKLTVAQGSPPPAAIATKEPEAPADDDTAVQPVALAADGPAASAEPRLVESAPTADQAPAAAAPSGDEPGKVPAVCVSFADGTRCTIPIPVPDGGVTYGQLQAMVEQETGRRVTSLFRVQEEEECVPGETIQSFDDLLACDWKESRAIVVSDVLGMQFTTEQLAEMCKLVSLGGCIERCTASTHTRQSVANLLLMFAIQVGHEPLRHSQLRYSDSECPKLYYNHRPGRGSLLLAIASEPPGRQFPFVSPV